MVEHQAVYRFELARDVPSGLAWLGPWEREHLATLRVPKRRNDWLLGRWAAKQTVALAPWGNVDPRQLADLEVRRTAEGGPSVFVRGVPEPVAISLSHRAGAALCVIAEAGSVGCDLEWIEERSAGFVEDYFTCTEQAMIEDYGPKGEARITNAMWSAKESVLKMLGVGLGVDTRSLTVCATLQPGQEIWRPFAVEVESLSRVYRGWWRQTDNWVLTMVSDPEGPMPLVANPTKGG